MLEDALLCETVKVRVTVGGRWVALAPEREVKRGAPLTRNRKQTMDEDFRRVPTSALLH